MPVIAVAPEENARSTNNTVTPSIGSRPTTGVGAKPRVKASTSPTAISPNMASTKAYVGAENIAPAWRTPRRLPANRIAIAASPIGTLACVSPGMAEVTAATPDEIETATVRV